MLVAGNKGASGLPELAAMGGAPTEGEPRRHFQVYTESSLESILELRHLMLTGGRVWVQSYTRQSVGDPGGGSLYIVGGAAVFRASNVLFAGCNNSYCSTGGGALYLNGGAQANITDSTFRGVKTTWVGGAVTLYNGKATFRNTHFVDNVALYFAGAIRIVGQSEVIFEGGNNSFRGNSGQWGRSIEGAGKARFTVCNHKSWQLAAGNYIGAHGKVGAIEKSFHGCPNMCPTGSSIATAGVNKAYHWSELCKDDTPPPSSLSDCPFSAYYNDVNVADPYVSFMTPYPGCRLNQVISLRQGHHMEISGLAHAKPLNELAAMGGEPQSGYPRRHFEVQDEAYLQLTALRLTGGRVWVHSYTRQSVGDPGGGSLYIVGGAAVFRASNVLFAGCNNSYCSTGGGALYLNGGAQANITDSTFRGVKTTWVGGAVTLYNGKATFRNTHFVDNVALYFAGAIRIVGQSEVIFEGGNNSFRGNSGQWGRSIEGAGKARFTVCNHKSWQLAAGNYIGAHGKVGAIEKSFHGCPNMCPTGSSIATAGVNKAYHWSELCKDDTPPPSSLSDCPFSAYYNDVNVADPYVSFMTPYPGCRLNQVISLRQGHHMEISGLAHAKPLNELAAMGGEPQSGYPRRHFEVSDGATLRLRDVRLTGGRVWVRPFGLLFSHHNDGDAYGGSIFVNGKSAFFYAKRCRFEGCGTNVFCSTSGGALYIHGGAQVNITDSMFRGIRVTYSGAAVSIIDGTATFSNTEFIDNVALYYAGAIKTTTAPSGQAILAGGNNYFSKNGAEQWGGNNKGQPTNIKFLTCNRQSWQSASGQYSVDDRGKSFRGCPFMCPAGTSTETAGVNKGYNKSQMCIRCASGMFRKRDGQICTNMTVNSCSPGYFFVSVSDGKFDDGVCLACPEGWIKARVGTDACVVCGAGKFANGENSTHCKSCPQGYFNLEEQAQIKCYECPDGKYQKELGRVTSLACLKCPRGYHAHESARGNCVMCEPGKFQVDEGADSLKGCLECPVLTYNPLYGHGAPCLPCTKNFNIGSSDCLLCSAGRYRIQIHNRYVNGQAYNGTACLNCPVGYFMEDVESTSCESCSPGKFTSGTGFVNCIDCAAGRFGSGCEECPAGFYRPHARKNESSNPNKCMSCPAGWFGIKGAKYCDACEAGRFGDMKASDKCKKCVDETEYQDIKGQTFCKFCPDGFVPNAQTRHFCEVPPWKMTTSCKLGEILDDSSHDNMNWNCAACPPGGHCPHVVALSALQPTNGWFPIPDSFKPSRSRPFAQCPFPSECQHVAKGYHQHTISDATPNITATTGISRNHSMRCTGGVGRNLSCACSETTNGLGCSQCRFGFARFGGGECGPCRAAEVPIRLLLMITLLIVVVVTIMFSLRRLIKLRQKYKHAIQDIALTLKIICSFLQINLSLQAVIDDFEWPLVYTDFINHFSLLDVDLFGQIGIGCVWQDFDYRYNVLIALAIPAAIVLVALLGFTRKLNSLHRQAQQPLTQKEHDEVMAKFFDMLDTDGSESIDSQELAEMVDTLQRMRQRKNRRSRSRVNTLRLSEKKARELIVSAGGDAKRGSISRAAFLRATTAKSGPRLLSFAGSIPHDLISGNIADQWTKQQVLRSGYMSTTIQILLLVHAPLSAKSFHYFNCVRLGEKSVLKRDFQLTCHTQIWTNFVPIAILLLLGFGLLLPFGLSMLLFHHRKRLHSPIVNQKIGWLYSRFNNGSEFWEVHEILRRLILTGILIHLPRSTRSVAAILLCVCAIASLHSFHPHKNSLVFRVASLSFFMTMCKYLIAVAGGRETGTGADNHLLGQLLIALDVIVIVCAFLCVLTLLVVLRGDLSATKSNVSSLINKEKVNKEKVDKECGNQNASKHGVPSRPISKRAKTLDMMLSQRAVFRRVRSVKAHQMVDESSRMRKNHLREQSRRQAAAKERLRLRLFERKMDETTEFQSQKPNVLNQASGSNFSREKTRL